MRKLMTAALATVALTAVAAPASAAVLSGTFQVTVSTGLTNGAGIDTATFKGFSGDNTASATFTYTGPIDFSNEAAQSGVNGDKNAAFGFNAGNISNYSGKGTLTYDNKQVADFTSTNGFIQSSGSASGQPYATFYTFALGNIAAGTTLTLTHDDGAALFQNGARVGSTVSGPTGKVTENVLFTNSGLTTLTYSRQNSTPSILTVSAVPEPATWAMMLVGFGMVGAVARRRKAAVKVTFA
jgi:hypothetical protein